MVALRARLPTPRRAHASCSASFDAFALGNHEFDGGDAKLASFIDHLTGSGAKLQAELDYEDFEWSQHGSVWRRVVGGPGRRHNSSLFSPSSASNGSFLGAAPCKPPDVLGANVVPGAARRTPPRSLRALCGRSRRGRRVWRRRVGRGGASRPLGESELGGRTRAPSGVARGAGPSSPLRGKLRPYAVYELGGERVGVVGLDTRVKVTNSSNPDPGTVVLDEATAAQARAAASRASRWRAQRRRRGEVAEMMVR